MGDSGWVEWEFSLDKLNCRNVAIDVASERQSGCRYAEKECDEDGQCERVLFCIFRTTNSTEELFGNEFIVQNKSRLVAPMRYK